jgi:hypothetical protein
MKVQSIWKNYRKRCQEENKRWCGGLLIGEYQSYDLEILQDQVSKNQLDESWDLRSSNVHKRMVAGCSNIRRFSILENVTLRYSKALNVVVT